MTAAELWDAGFEDEAELADWLDPKALADERDGAARLRLVTPPPDPGAAAREAAEAEPAAERAPLDRRWNLAPLDFTAPFPTPNFLIPGLEIGPGRPCGVLGKPHGGKSDFAQTIAIGIAAGVRIYGRFECKRGRVLHLTYDMGRDSVRLRYHRLAEGLRLTRPQLHGQIEIAAYPQIDLTSPNALRLFTRAIAGKALVVLDNMREATPGADENASTFGGFVTVFGKACAAAGATGVYLHHSGKDSGPDNPFRGSNSLAGASGACWFAEGDGADPRCMTHARGHDDSDGPKDSFWIVRSEFEGTGEFFLPARPAYDGRPAQRYTAVAYEARDESPAQVQKATKAAALTKSNEAGNDARVLKVIRENPGIGASDLRTKSGLIENFADAAVGRLMVAGLVEDQGPGGPRRPRKFHARES